MYIIALRQERSDCFAEKSDWRVCTAWWRSLLHKAKGLCRAKANAKASCGLKNHIIFPEAAKFSVTFK